MPIIATVVSPLPGLAMHYVSVCICALGASLLMRRRWPAAVVSLVAFAGAILLGHGWRNFSHDCYTAWNDLIVDPVLRGQILCCPSRGTFLAVIFSWVVPIALAWAIVRRVNSVMEQHK